MDTELMDLHSIINSYKCIITKNLNDIDSFTLETLNSRLNDHISDKKKHIISRTLVRLLNNYVDISYLTKSSFSDIRKSFEMLLKDCNPVREESCMSNPFLIIESPTLENESFYDVVGASSTSSDFQSLNSSDGETLVGDADLISNSSKVSIEEVTEVKPTLPPLEQQIELTKNYTLENTIDKNDFGVTERTNSESNPFRPINTNNVKQEKEIEENKVDHSQTITKSKLHSKDLTKKTTSPSKPKNTAVSKLFSMRVHDRRHEALKQYETKPKFNFELKPVPVPKKLVSPSNQKKSKKSKVKNNFVIGDFKLLVKDRCTICYVSTPLEFYVRSSPQLFENFQCEVNEYLNKMHTYTISNFKSKQEAQETIGNYGFIYRPEEGRWLRVAVIDWLQSEEAIIKVQSIDYGVKFHCKIEQLKPMIEQYAQYPRMATKCFLVNLCPPNKTMNNQWPERSISVLNEYIDLSLLIVFAEKYGDSYGIDLWIDEEEISLGQMLLDRKLASSDLTDCDESELDIAADDEIVEYDNINEAITGYDAQDEARICPFTDSTGRCFKKASCKLDHGKLSEDGVTTDKMLVVRQPYAELILPDSGQFTKVLVTGYIDTCHFYVQILNYKHEFQSLQSNLCSNNIVQNYKPFKLDPGIGELVLVRHDSGWHRGKCVGFKSAGVIMIDFVDFGFTADKKLSALRQIEENFLHLPFQAVECLLEDVQEKHDTDVDKSYEFFNTYMKFKEFQAYVSDSNEPLRLKLWDADGKEIKNVLKENGLIMNRVVNCVPAKNCPLDLA